MTELTEFFSVIQKSRSVTEKINPAGDQGFV